MAVVSLSGEAARAVARTVARAIGRVQPTLISIAMGLGFSAPGKVSLSKPFLKSPLISEGSHSLTFMMTFGFERDTINQYMGAAVFGFDSDQSGMRYAASTAWLESWVRMA
jgi:hypothetical protein